MSVDGGSNAGDWIGDVGSTPDRFTIGAFRRSTAVWFLQGRVAFVGVYDTPLAPGDRTSLYSWIASYYGI